MSLLFDVRFRESPLHVLELRGRPAFLAREIGAAAGYLDAADFVDTITREWGASLEDDDDLGFLTPRELRAFHRELPDVPVNDRTLVLFAPGVDKTLARSHARHARPLRTFLAGVRCPALPQIRASMGR